jgi:hypothetical protein
MQKLRTVRISYLYIFMGSALLSATLLFVIHSVIILFYSHYLGRTSMFLIRLIHWVINHIGKTPSAIALFVLLFSGLYILRSQKVADDLHAVLVGTSELADKGVTHEIKVLSGGELGEIVANLNRMQKIRVEEDTPTVALLLRTRAILRTLHEVEAARNMDEAEVQKLLAAANGEVRSMEQFLKNLIIES